MTNWQSIPTLVGTGADAVHRFAKAAGLTESQLRQSDWEEIPYLPPAALAEGEEAGFQWQQQTTYAAYRVRTSTKDLWLFWLAFRDWHQGEFLPMDPQVVSHWQRPGPHMMTRCAYRLCFNPALIWPDPALSLQIELYNQTYTVNFYGCGDAHREALRATGASRWPS